MPVMTADEVSRSSELIDERIRQKACALWLEDGALEGCADEYWRQARELVKNEVNDERLATQLGKMKRSK